MNYRTLAAAAGVHPFTVLVVLIAVTLESTGQPADGVGQIEQTLRRRVWLEDVVGQVEGVFRIGRTVQRGGVAHHTIRETNGGVIHHRRYGCSASDLNWLVLVVRWMFHPITLRSKLSSNLLQRINPRSINSFQINQTNQINKYQSNHWGISDAVDETRRASLR